MLRPNLANLRLVAVLSVAGIVVLALGAGARFAAGKANDDGGTAEIKQIEQAAHAGGMASATTGGNMVTAVGGGEELKEGYDRLRSTSRLRLPRRSTSAGRTYESDAYYLVLASVAVLLAVVGGLALAARRLKPRAGSGALQIVSRVSLSPKHAMYVVRAGGRVLLVGTGPQSSPSLISELDDMAVSLPEPARGQGDVS